MPAPRHLLVIAALASASLVGVAHAAEPAVVAVVAVDGYADLKKQIGWFGERVGNPTLAALAECIACCGGSCTARCRKPQSMFERSVAAAPRTSCASEPIWMPRTPWRDHSDQRT